MKTPVVTHMSSERGFASWWRRVFSGGSASSQVSRRASSDVQRASKANSELVEVDSAWLQHAPEFAPFAQALGIEFNLPVALSAAQLEQALQLTASVVEAAAQDQSGPTSMPTAALRTLNLVCRPDVEVSELASSIHQDPALTAAVLRMANSAGMGAAVEVHTVRDALTRLGLVESARVVGAVAAKTLFTPSLKSAHELFITQFNELHVAAAAAAGGAAHLSMERVVGRSDLAYLGGMLHEVGKSIALSALAEMMIAGRGPREVEPNVLLHVIESRHVELGVRAHERWGLPQYLTTLCASQNKANVSVDPANAELHLVRVVSGLLALRVRPQSLARIAQVVQSLGMLGITPLQARALDAGLRTRAAQVHQVLGL
jgi:HD-like signal output (HDOD) protein